MRSLQGFDVISKECKSKSTGPIAYKWNLEIVDDKGLATTGSGSGGVGSADQAAEVATSLSPGRRSFIGQFKFKLKQFKLIFKSIIIFIFISTAGFSVIQY